ncbi:MAG TPA: hypothetical protein VMH30_01565 [Verrucomicrobiae bacterium]|nr:hypothetical protein [Verrucomicrobiae bacterium]
MAIENEDGGWRKEIGGQSVDSLKGRDNLRLMSGKGGEACLQKGSDTVATIKGAGLQFQPRGTKKSRDLSFGSERFPPPRGFSFFSGLSRGAYGQAVVDGE